MLDSFWSVCHGARGWLVVFVFNGTSGGASGTAAEVGWVAGRCVERNGLVSDNIVIASSYFITTTTPIQTERNVYISPAINRYLNS